MGLVVAGDGDGEAEAVLVPGLLQQFFGLAHIMGIPLGQSRVKVLAEGRIHGGAHLGAMAVGGQLQHGVHIHSIAQGLTHQLIVEGSHGVVQVQGLDKIHGTLQHLVAVGQVVHLVHGQVGHKVQGAAVEGGEESIVVLIDLVGHLIQAGALAVVCLVAFKDEILLDAAGSKTEGAGAHRGSGLLVIALGDNVNAGNIAEEVRIGSVQGDDDGIALSANIGNRRKRRHHGFGHRGSGAGFKGIEHVLHRAALAVVENHTVPERKGVSQAILRHIIVRGDRADVITVSIGLYQPFEDVEHDLSSSCRHNLVRVKTIIQVLGDANHDLIGVLRPGRICSFVAGSRALGRRSSAAAE